MTYRHTYYTWMHARKTLNLPVLAANNYNYIIHFSIELVTINKDVCSILYKVKIYVSGTLN